MMRRLAYRVAHASGLNRAARAAMRRRPLVLCYHGVCGGDRADVPDPAGMHVPARRFAEQIELLLRLYRPISLAELTAHVVDGAPLPPSSLLITFDDGYANLAEHAFPLLRRRGVPSALFVVTGTTTRRQWLWTSEADWRLSGNPRAAEVKRELKRLDVAARAERLRTLESKGAPHFACDYSLLDWEQLRAAARSGSVAVGSHGVEHQPLVTCDDAGVREELVASRRALESELGLAATAVAYPNGDVSAPIAAQARAAGYRIGFSTADRHCRADDDALVLPRILIGASDDAATLAGRLAGWREWLR
ncbi:MAG: polysaccharide deacetylase [bacterium]|nr:polysaccharide deacetylase [bacterium]